MDRSRRLASLWNWLPAFRAVAETQHLPTASAALFVSPSALSRTIKLLEEDIGHPLFDRVGRRLELNEPGRRLLGSVRDAMRLVDEGLGQLAGTQFVGPVRISVPGPFAPMFVLPALHALARAHPGLVPELSPTPAGRANEMLLTGALDLAVLDDPVPSDELTLRALAEITHGIWCAPQHPLSGRRRVTLEQVAAHPFVAPRADPRGHTPDAWPPELVRAIGLRVTRMQVAVDACASGQWLGALPDLVARRAGLHRVPLDVLPSSTLYLLHRPSLPVRGKTEALVDAVLEAAEAHAG